MADMRFTSSHEWATADGDLVTVGITSFAVEQLTDVTHLQLPKVGFAASAGKPFGEIESVKAVFDLNSPVTGEIVEKNLAVEKDPSLINQDPYGKGWMVKIRLAPGANLEHLLDKAAYEKQVADSH
jgi:glycine cleavage system H protein